MTQVIDIAGASPEKASSDNAAFYYPVQLGQCLSVLLHKKCQESLALEGLAYLFLASWHQRNIMFGHSCCALLPLGILSILFQSEVGYFVRTLFVCAGLPPSVGVAWLRLGAVGVGAGLRNRWCEFVPWNFDFCWRWFWSALHSPTSFNMILGEAMSLYCVVGFAALAR